MTRKIIKQRQRIFIAAEGESEQSFVKWLQQLSDEKELHVHLDCLALNGGGYKPMLEKAARERKRKERNKAKWSILLVDSDRDKRNDDGWSLEELKQKALKQKINVCVQNPNFEGLLLKMLQKNGVKIQNQLQRVWPDYKKPADARTLLAKFSLNDLLRVAHNDSELKNLLKKIGLHIF